MRLVLLPARIGHPVVCRLHEVTPLSEAAQPVSGIAQNAFVYSDANYRARIEWNEEGVPYNIQIFVNGDLIEYTTEDMTEDYLLLNFKSEYNSYGNIFHDSYGYVQVELRCFYDDEPEGKRYVTDYMGVMLRATKANEALQKMAGFVYGRIQHYMEPSQLPSAVVHIEENGNKEENEKTLDQQIQLIRDVLECFENAEPFLRTQPRMDIRRTDRVDSFEKLEQVTPKTLQYIVTHPDELRVTSLNTGILYNDLSFFPKRTLVSSTEQTRDCYENRMVVGFLREALTNVHLLIEKIETILKREIPIGQVSNGYLISSEFILEATRQNLRENLQEIEQLEERLSRVYWSYRSVLPVEELHVLSLPRLTTTFLSAHPYREIYEIMARWFAFGIYDFTSEDYLLPLLVHHQLYEYYGLFQIAEGIEQEGYVYIPGERNNFSYPVVSNLYEKTEYYNTFVFRNENGETVTLYYQPVIWGQGYTEYNSNGIALRRTTTLSMEHDDALTPYKSGNAFYTPDYVIRYQGNGQERYLIAEAKYQSYASVWNKQIERIAFKYTFSIQPTKENSTLMGTVLLYGKSTERPCVCETVHDIFEDPRYPVFWLCSLTEGEEEEENARIETMRNLVRFVSGRPYTRPLAHGEVQTMDRRNEESESPRMPAEAVL